MRDGWHLCCMRPSIIALCVYLHKCCLQILRSYRKTSLPLLLPEYLAGWPQSKQWSRNWNDDVCERRLVRTSIWLSFCDFTDSFSISERLLTVWMNSVTMTIAHTSSPRSRLASLIPSLRCWRRTTVGLFWSSIIVFFTNHADDTLQRTNTGYKLIY